MRGRDRSRATVRAPRRRGGSPDIPVVDFTTLAEGATVLPASVVYSRASNADYVSYTTGPVYNVASGVPRVRANRAGKVGLIVEKAVTRRIASHSVIVFGTGEWTSAGTGAAVSSGAGPGTLPNATRITNAAGQYSPFGVVAHAGTYFRLRVYAKGATGSTAHQVATSVPAIGIASAGSTALASAAWSLVSHSRYVGASPTPTVLLADGRAWPAALYGAGIAAAAEDLYLSGAYLQDGLEDSEPAWCGSRVVGSCVLTNAVASLVSGGVLRARLSVTPNTHPRQVAAEACIADFANGCFATYVPTTARVKLYVGGVLVYTSARQVAPWTAGVEMQWEFEFGASTPIRIAYRHGSGAWRALDEGAAPGAITATGNVRLGAKADGTMVFPSADWHSLATFARGHWSSAAASCVGPQYVCAGDSLMAGLIDPYDASSVPSRIGASLGASWDGWTVAVPGRQATEVLAAQDWLAPSCSARSAQTLVLNVGTNDLNSGRTAAQVLADLTSIVSQAQSAGYRVVLATIPLRTEFESNATKNGHRTSLNSSLMAGSSGADAVVDYQSDAMFATSSSAAFLNDHVHFNSTGQAYMAAQLAARVP